MSCVRCTVMCFFFKQKTAYEMRISDWSSDVCSSDLVAMSSILREPDLHAKGRPIKVDGRYLASWNAYPQPGMEEGPAVIGLAWSDDLIRWHRDRKSVV